MSVAQLAAMYGVEPAVVERSAPGQHVRVTTRPMLELTLEAARACLTRAMVDMDSVDTVIWVGQVASPRPAHLLERLGASKTTVIEVTGRCEQAITSLRLAAALIMADPHLRRIMVVGGNVWKKRSIAPLHPKRSEILHSDAAACFLVERSARPCALLGFGTAMDDRFFEYLREVYEGTAAMSHLQALYESTWVNDAALDQALRTAGLKHADIDLLGPQFEPAGMAEAWMRSLRLPKAKLLTVRDGPTHTGPFDCAFHLDALLRAPSPVEARALLVARTMGTMSFVAVGLGPREASFST
jgi:3-oxoacyl-[acyl-carrier-protein] synthase III